MASGEQLKALLKSHADGDDDRFFSVAMQVAAHAARRGHGRLAEELRTLIDRAKSKPGAGAPVPIGRPRGELANLLGASYPSERLGQMVLGKQLADQIRRVIREQRHAGRIVERGLASRRKLLLTGPPGTGKTMTASILAGELGLPLLQVRLDGLIHRGVRGNAGVSVATTGRQSCCCARATVPATPVRYSAKWRRFSAAQLDLAGARTTVPTTDCPPRAGPWRRPGWAAGRSPRRSRAPQAAARRASGG